MLVLSDVLVTKTRENTFNLDWALIDDGLDPDPDDAIDPDDYQIKIAVSESPTTEFVHIQEYNTEDPPVLVDVVVDCATESTYTWPEPHHDLNRSFYFKIEVSPKVEPDTIVLTSSGHCFDRPDGVAMSIAYVEGLLYRNYTGYSAVVWRKKMEGAFCPECWNPLTRSSNKSRCSTCQGTGKTKSYYNGIDIQCAFEYGNSSQNVSQTTVMTNQQNQARISNYPLVRPGDMMLDKDTARRFVIERVQRTQLPNVRRTAGSLSGKIYIVSQILALKELTTSDPEYGITY